MLVGSLNRRSPDIEGVYRETAIWAEACNAAGASAERRFATGEAYKRLSHLSLTNH